MTETIKLSQISFQPTTKFHRNFTPTQKKILKLLYFSHRGLSRDEISEKLDIPRTTIFDNIFRNTDKINLEQEIIKYRKDRLGTRGRPKKIFYLNL